MGDIPGMCNPGICVLFCVLLRIHCGAFCRGPVPSTLSAENTPFDEAAKDVARSFATGRPYPVFGSSVVLLLCLHRALRGA